MVSHGSQLTIYLVMHKHIKCMFLFFFKKHENDRKSVCGPQLYLGKLFSCWCQSADLCAI